MTSRSMHGLLVLGLALCAAGCGSNVPVPPGGMAAKGSTGEQNASLHTSVDLVGIWLGSAVMDRAGLQRHLEALTDVAERARIEEMADSFESISIAMEFRADATLEIEVEFLPENSAPIRENTTGNWKILASDENSITVSCLEHFGDGQVDEQTMRYEITSDRDHISTVVPVGIELRPFLPRFEFERREETQMAEQPAGGEIILR